MPFWLRMIFFVATMLVLVGLTSAYVHRRLSKLIGLKRPARLALAGVLVAAPVGLIVSRSMEPTLGPGATFVLGAVSATIILGVWISTVLVGVVDLIALLGRFARARGPAAAEAEIVEPPTDEPEPDGGAETDGAPLVLGRRDVLRTGATGAALSVGFGSAAYGALFGRHDYELNEIPIPIPGLDRALEGYRIAQISDVHFGSYVGEEELRSAVALMRRARPDLIVLTGDLLDHDAAYAPWLGRMIRAFEGVGARDGVALIPGNHDYYAGVEEVLGVSSRAGARVLRNDGVVLQDRFALLGVDDVWARRNGYSGGPDLAAAIAKVPEDLPRVLLCHNPSFFEEAQGQVALQLSGHTHGGQVNLGVRPADLVLPYVHGLYEEGGSRLYVNRGFGTAGPPARVGAPPEINVSVLLSA